MAFWYKIEKFLELGPSHSYAAYDTALVVSIAILKQIIKIGKKKK